MMIIGFIVRELMIGCNVCLCSVCVLDWPLTGPTTAQTLICGLTEKERGRGKAEESRQERARNVNERKR